MPVYSVTLSTHAPRPFCPSFDIQANTLAVLPLLLAEPGVVAKDLTAHHVHGRYNAALVPVFYVSKPSTYR